MDDRLKELRNGDVCLCECPDWCELGYQVAIWNGKEFEYPMQENHMFNEHVTGFEKIEDIY